MGGSADSSRVGDDLAEERAVGKVDMFLGKKIKLVEMDWRARAHVKVNAGDDRTGQGCCDFVLVCGIHI